MSHLLGLKDLDLKGKRVLMRVDFNVPLDEKGNITDDSRIIASLPSIKYVIDHGGKLILMSHLGRPKGTPSPQFSLAPVTKRLSQLLKKEVQFASDCVGEKVKGMVDKLASGQILLLENLRFYKAEEKPETDSTFAKKLADLGDIYVNDGFGTAHRAHASTAEIAKYFPGKAAAGFLLEKEIHELSRLLNPQKPFQAIIGGAKISTKMGVLKSLVDKVDVLMIGGGMAYTFMKAQNIAIGDSIHEDESIEDTKSLIELCRKKKVKLMLPIDIVVADRFDNDAKTKIVNASQGIPSGFQGMDIGPKSIAAFTQELALARTVFWNGPMGVFEFDNFAKGTEAIAKALAELPITKIVGGGDSIAALNKLHLGNKMTHLSTGGGASLEFIEFGTLPGIEALKGVALQK